MKDREHVVVGGVFVVLLVAWLGFLVHRSPRFPGSGVGAIFGISGAALMLVPLAYPLVKRVPFIHDRVVKYISIKAILTVHVYTGILGPLLAIIHTGHRFESTVGVLLTGVMLLVVVSGLIIRYVLAYVGHEISDKLILLQTARGDLDNAWGALEPAPADGAAARGGALLAAGLASLGVDLSARGGAAGEVMRIAESVADLEYAIRTHELFKRWFARTLTVHIALSLLFYALLALHIGAGIYFGLRWLR